MADTNIGEEIDTLRDQLAGAEAAVARARSQVAAAGQVSPEAVAAQERELGELIEARDFMVSRLSRLESCKRSLD